MSIKPILVTSGEPAGIGLDLCLDLLNQPYPIVVLADPNLLLARAAMLGKTLNIETFSFDRPYSSRPHHLQVWPLSCPVSIRPGELNSGASEYVLTMLRRAAEMCLTDQAAAVVTAPVHKAVINRAGFPFSGHTEFFAELADSSTVMLLASDLLKVSLVTTHLPLHAVPAALTQDILHQHLNILYRSLQYDFGIEQPRLHLLGLNPHAGEDGYLGEEEQTIIRPVISAWQKQGKLIEGPYAADTAFLEKQSCDVVVAMYHDQGLPVLKYASFGQAVNVTCGLPFIRTSVDHGTALSLAGSGQAMSGSLLAAVDLAAEMVKKRAENKFNCRG